MTTYAKSTPAIIQAVHRLRGEGRSIRAIAAELKTTKAIVEQAIKKGPPALPGPRRAREAPRLEVYRTLRVPAPCPVSASSLVRRVYESIRPPVGLGCRFR
jgi:hypothetical protein